MISFTAIKREALDLFHSATEATLSIRSTPRLKPQGEEMGRSVISSTAGERHGLGTTTHTPSADSPHSLGREGPGFIH